MDSRDLLPDQDPPAAAALYLSSLDHEHHYSAVDLWHAVSRRQATIDNPSALLELYRQSVQGASTPEEHYVRARRRAWALRMAGHLAQEGRPGTAVAAPARADWERPVTDPSEMSPRMPAASPPHQSAPESLPDPKQALALRELRATRRRPARIAAAVVGAQMAGVILANEAPGVMAITWTGPLNIGLALVLAQSAFTGWAILWYLRYARRSVEPVVRRHSASFPHLQSRR